MTLITRREAIHQSTLFALAQLAHVKKREGFHDEHDFGIRGNPFYGDIIPHYLTASDGSKRLVASEYVFDTQKQVNRGIKPRLRVLGKPPRIDVTDYIKARGVRHPTISLPHPLITISGEGHYENHSQVFGQRNFGRLETSPYEDERAINKFEVKFKSGVFPFFPYRINNEDEKIRYHDRLINYFNEFDLRHLKPHVNDILCWLLGNNRYGGSLQLPPMEILNALLKQAHEPESKTTVVSDLFDRLTLKESSGNRNPFSSLGGIVDLNDFNQPNGDASSFMVRGGLFVGHALCAEERNDRGIVTYPLAFNQDEWNTHWSGLPVRWERKDAIATGTVGGLIENNRIPLGEMLVYYTTFIIQQDEEALPSVWMSEYYNPINYKTHIEKIFQRYPGATVFLPDQGLMVPMIASDGGVVLPIYHNSNFYKGNRVSPDTLDSLGNRSNASGYSFNNDDIAWTNRPIIPALEMVKTK